MFTTEFSSELAVFERLAGTDARSACEALVSTFYEGMGAAQSAFYLFDPAIGAFRYQSKDNLTELPDFRSYELGDIIDLLRGVWGTVELIEVKRGRRAVAYLFANDPNFRNTVSDDLRYLPFIYNRIQNERLVSNLNSPLKFDGDYTNFVKQLTKLAKGASATSHGAYRAIHGKRLECLFSWGFNEDVEHPSRLDVHIDEVKDFKEAIYERRVTVCTDLPKAYPSLIASQSHQNQVKSFCAIPVEVGEKIVGLLTVGIADYYAFSEVEKEGYRCVSNGLGVSISNYRHYWRGKKYADDFDNIASSLSALEVVHQIRHNILNDAGGASSSAQSLLRAVPKSKLTENHKELFTSSLESIREYSDHVDKNVSSIGEAIALESFVEMVSLKEIWEEVKDHMKVKIKEMNVSVSDVGKKDPQPVIKSAIKHILQNLLLNSLSAFEGTSPQGRSINLTWNKGSKPSRAWSFTYSDNGPGLPIGQLELLLAEQSSHPLSDVDKDMRLGEFIFLPGTTTKSTGTGRGLYLSRRKAKLHNGGIEYISPHDGGVIFDISISYDLDRLIKNSKLPLYHKVGDLKKEVLLTSGQFFDEIRKSR